MNKKNIFWGLLLVLAGAYLLVSQMGLIPELPFFTVVFTIIFVYTAVQGVFKKSFLLTLMSVALLGWVYEDYLGIEEITPLPLILAVFLVGLGLDLIFMNVLHKKKNSKWNNNFGSAGFKGKVPHKGIIENIQDGESVSLSNSFGTISKYINSGIFRDATIKNSFGNCNVYFNNAIMKENKAMVKVENAFGETNLYFPSTWRVEIKQSASVGDVQCHGMASVNPESPCVYVEAESSFGSIHIYAE